MTKGIVTCNLYKRNSRPSVNAERMGHYVSGDEVEILDVVLGETENDYYEGTPTWYKLTGDIYVWSGGVSLDLDDSLFSKKIKLDRSISEQNKREKSKDPNSPSAPLDLSKEFVLNTSLPGGNGENIVIAVLDTGIEISGFSSLKKVISSHNFQSDTGPNDHGTRVAGVIGSDGSGLTGIAPACRFIDLRIADSGGFVSDDAVYLALDHLIKWNKNSKNPFCHIVNMSLDVDSDLIEIIQPLIDDLVGQGVAVVVAGNEAGSMNNLSSLLGALPIGVFEENDFSKEKKNGLDDGLCLSFLNKDVATISFKAKKSELADSSAYTAVTSALIARYLSSKGSTSIDVQTFLKRISFPIKSDDKPSNYKPYRNEKS